MKTSEVIINSNGDGMEKAIEETQRLAEESGLTHKEQIRLRLLSEELFGIMKGATGEAEGSYYVEREGKSFEIHLVSDVDLTKEMKLTLLSVATSGENDAVKGFMSKIKDMIGTAMLPADDAISRMSSGLMSMGSPSSFRTGETYEWSMRQYKSGIQNAEGKEAEEAWDELEKSIVANIADDVKISITGYTVKVVISKAF